MIQPIPENLLEEISRLISVHTGLHFPEKKWNALSKAITSVISDTHTGIDEFIRCLRVSPPREMIDSLTARLTIGETYFLRDKNFFQILQDHILRGIIDHPKRKTRKINFWCAGCASGEEPYSIAILIDQMFPVLKDWEINIIGSDINPVAIDKAEQGLYSTWSLRETPEKIIKRYFTPAAGGYFALAPLIRQMVNFVQLNLMVDHYPSILNCHDGMDVILCRNVLMYFNNHGRNSVLQKLSGLLIDNGWLITGPAESGFVNLPEFTPVRFPNALYHRKGPPRKIADYPPPIRMNRSVHASRPAVSGTPERRVSDRRLERRLSDTGASRPPEKPKYDMYQDALDDYNRGEYSLSVKKLLAILSPDRNHSNAFLMKAESMILLAKAYANIGELEDARIWCEQAISAEKLNPEIYYLLSTIFQSAGDSDAAVKALKQSIYLDPEFIMAHFTLGMLLLQKRLTQDSNKSMRNALLLLEQIDNDEVVPHSEGMTAGRLIQTINSMKTD